MGDPIRLAIVGSVMWTSAGEAAARWFIEDALDRYQPSVVISGGADGVDTWAARAAERRGIPVKERLPQNKRWRPNGFEARNLLIAQDCTHLVAIRSRVSKTFGSGWTADKAEQMGKPVERHLLPL